MACDEREGYFGARHHRRNGSSLKKLDVRASSGLTGNGVSQCASCDAAAATRPGCRRGRGGDSAMQEALTLAEFASKTIFSIVARH